MLTKYEDLVDWGVQSGAVTVEEARVLRARAAAYPAAADRVLLRAREAREILFGIFSPAARGGPVPANLIRELNHLVSGALARRVVEPHGDGFRWAWKDSERVALCRPLWPAIVSAAELLTSGDLRKIRQCEGSGCAWLFVDASRNGSRRWCDMSVCGNRVKARRH